MSILIFFYSLLVVQGLAMVVDEFYFHYRRNLIFWERVGHGFDTLSVLAVFLALEIISSVGAAATSGIIALMVFSCLFVTKDEWIHHRYCSAGEQWLHSVQFLVHSALYVTAWMIWKSGIPTAAFKIEILILFFFSLYQFVFWNFFKPPIVESSVSRSVPKVNNDLYHDLGIRWYQANDNPIALLRAEAKIKNPWVKKTILNSISISEPSCIRVLDVGCGAGFLSNDLAKEGFQVTGLDISESSLAIAKIYDQSRSVNYVQGDAYHLPFESGSFEVVTCMDFLEHVNDPFEIIQEAARVLTPNGILIFHTFNRNWLSWLVVIKGVEFFIKNTPAGLHVLHLFVKPEELERYCKKSGLIPMKMGGISPEIFTWAFLKMLFTREVPPSFSFKLHSFKMLGYVGYAQKNRANVSLKTLEITK